MIQTIDYLKIIELTGLSKTQAKLIVSSVKKTLINQQMIFLHKLYDVAISKGICNNNPCNSLKRLSEQNKEMAYYTPDEFKLFDSYFLENEYHLKLLYRVLMFSGIRMGEALALTWKDINFIDKTIRVTKTAYYRNHQVFLGTTKTTSSNRVIYIHDAFVKELKEWQESHAHILSDLVKNTDDLQIFQISPEVLTAPNVANFRIALKKRLPKDFKLIRNHDFRHSHAAFLISQGLRNGEGKDYIFFTLMKRLGHSSITTTINTYSHLFPSQQQEVANAFDDF